jgi:amino acid transporter
MDQREQFERVLSKNDLFILGLGNIIGIGILIIVSSVAKNCGNYSWLAMCIAGIFALLTALSYSEISSAFHNNSSEIGFVKYAFNTDMGANIIGIIIFITEIIILSSISQGFGLYFTNIFKSFNPIFVSILAVILFSYINYRGIKLSADFSKYFLAINVGIMFILIIYGIMNIKSSKILVEKNASASDLIKGSVAALFCFLGFSANTNYISESKDPSQIPQVIIITTLFSIFCFTLVMISLQVGLGSKQIANSTAPLRDLIKLYFGEIGGLIFSVIALAFISNCLLLTCLTESRFLHSLIENISQPLSDADMKSKYGTPYISIIIVCILTICCILFFKSINKTALFGDVLTIGIFIMVNMIAIFLRYYDDEKMKRTYIMPLNFGKLPITAVLGVILGCGALGMLCKNGGH